jgi:YebC/PmpR family DNA-binding regulatory protein
MTGHSKWATIKRKKAATDQARGKVFSKYIKEITVAARQGGGDLDTNPRLRTAVAAAKSVNMPANNIDRAIARGTGAVEGANYEETQYEGYGPGGVALLVEVATDNKNRTAGDIRHIFTKNNGNLGEAGSVAYMFKPRGVILVDKKATGEEALIEVALDAGADDVSSEGDTYEVLTPPAQLEAVKQALAAKQIAVQSAEATKLSSLQVPVSEKDAEAIVRLMDALEDHDDVLRVYSNFSAPDEVLARLSR